jgi:23S rRNA pseudouridine1911/1915/1917 synthase
MNSPYILEETENFAVVFKPEKMHCAPRNYNFNDEGSANDPYNNTLLDWYREQHGKAENINIIHRLDFETHGLVLFSKNEKSFAYFRDLQESGGFIKEYSAICQNSIPAEENFSGFPPPPALDTTQLSPEKPLVIESYFRPYGQGRKLVRPVIEGAIKKHKETAKDRGGYYKTKIVNININTFTLQITRGFRHQIRCHLCWAGYPIINDPLYSHGETTPAGELALRAHALFFADPSGRKREYRIDSFA